MKVAFVTILLVQGSVGFAQMRPPATGTLTRSEAMSSPVYSASEIEPVGKAPSLPTDAALLTARKIVKCALPKNSSSALKFIATGKMTSSLLATFDSCLSADIGAGAGKQVRMGGDVSAALVAEAYYLKYGLSPLPAISLSELRAKPYWATSEPIVRLSLCVLGASPAEVSRLLMTAIGSSEEKAGIAALVPTVRGCVEEGVKVSLGRDVLRLNLANASLLRAREIPNAFVQPNRN